MGLWWGCGSEGLVSLMKPKLGTGSAMMGGCCPKTKRTPFSNSPAELGSLIINQYTHIILNTKCKQILKY